MSASIDRLYFTPTGLVGMQWDDRRESAPSEPIEHPIRWLRTRCEVEPGTTLGAVFEYVRRHSDLAEFIQFYSHCRDIDQWHAELDRKRPKVDDGGERLDRVEISWRVSIDDDDLCLETSICAPGPAGKATSPGASESAELPYALDFIPMTVLAGLPLKLVQRVEITDERAKPASSRGSHKSRVLARTCKAFTLLDVLDAIYWEISFYGNPKKTRRKRRSLLRGHSGAGPTSPAMPPAQRER